MIKHFLSQLVGTVTQGGATALHVAAKKGHLRVVEMLLEANADVNIKTNVSTLIYLKSI